METEKSRSESPFSRSKTKSHLSDASEIGNTVIEQIKTKKKNLRNKSKSQPNGKENEEVAKNGKENEEVEKNGKENEEIPKNGKENEEVPKNGKENEEIAKNGKENEEIAKNGKENEEIPKNGKDFFEGEKPIQNEIDRNFDSNNGVHEFGIENGKSPENSKKKNEASKEEVIDNKENDALISTCEIPEEKITNESKSLIIENNSSEECKSTEKITTANNKENFTEQDSKLETTETESSAKKNNSSASDLMSECEIVPGNFGEACSENDNGISNTEINISVEEIETSENCLEVKKSAQTSNTKTDVCSHYKEDNAKDHIQESPDTATKDDFSISIRITNLLGKWGYSQEQKQDSEVSSSKKIENTIINQFDLSKVSGRRGIKDRLNSSAAVFSSKEMEAKTPESSQISLDDSFRVRTNPPRLNSLHINENPTLRKFKGKRCLNAEDEPEEDDIYFNTMKKRKLDEKAQNSGFLGNILWSPFKKKYYDDKNQLKLATTESKLSRLLSPFWFWKKTGTEQEDK